MSDLDVHTYPAPEAPLAPSRQTMSLRELLRALAGDRQRVFVAYHDSLAGLVVGLVALIHPRLHAVWQPARGNRKPLQRLFRSALSSAIVVNNSDHLSRLELSDRAVLVKASIIDDSANDLQACSSVDQRVLGRAPRIIRIARSDTFATIQLTQLKEQRRFGADLSLCSDEGPLVSPLREANLPVSTMGIGRRPGPIEVALFAVRLRFTCRGKNTIVHAHNGPQILAVRISRLMAWRCCVVESHHNMHDLMESSRSGRLGRLALRLTNRIPSRCAFISEVYRDDAVREKLVLAERSSVVGTGIDLADLIERQRTSPPEDEIRRGLGVSPHSKVIACIARMDPQKGHAVLFESITRVIEERSDIQLLLIGDGPMRDELEQLARSKQLGEHVFFLGHRHDVAELLTIASAVVLTSENEGFGRCVVEGLATGLPVVATASKGPELILSGVSSARIVAHEAGAVAAAILGCLEHPMTDEQRDEARQRAALFDELPVARAVLDLYERC